MGILLENDAEIVLDRCKFFVRHLNASIGEQVHFVLLDLLVENFSGLVKESALNLSAVHVYEPNFKEGTTLVGCPFLGFARNTRLDLPVPGESVQGLQRHVHVARIGQRNDTDTCLHGGSGVGRGGSDRGLVAGLVLL